MQKKCGSGERLVRTLIQKPVIYVFNKRKSQISASSGNVFRNSTCFGFRISESLRTVYISG